MQKKLEVKRARITNPRQRLNNLTNPNADHSFAGILKSVVMGGLGAAVGHGVGTLFQGAPAGFVTVLGKAIAHTSTQAFTGLAFGQHPTAGSMAATFFGSSMGSAMEATKKVTTGMMIGMSSLAGGMGSVIAGGNFYQGAIMGGLISTVNHAMHKSQHNKYEKAMNEKAVAALEKWQINLNGPHNIFEAIGTESLLDNVVRLSGPVVFRSPNDDSFFGSFIVAEPRVQVIFAKPRLEQYAGDYLKQGINPDPTRYYFRFMGSGPYGGQWFYGSFPANPLIQWAR